MKKPDTMKRVGIIKKLIGKDLLFAILNGLKFIPDKLFLKIEYRFLTGRKLNLKNPVLFNEKLQYLKLYNRKPIYTVMADKYLMRSFVKEKTGRDLTVPLLGVWEKVEDIDFSTLPSSFVLKCNHDSKGLVICKDKTSFNVEPALKFLKKSMKKNMFWAAREWPYKNIKPKIICECFIDNLFEYQVLCFNGQPRLLYVMGKNSEGKLTENFYDMNFCPLDISFGYEKSNALIEKPFCFEEIKQISAILSERCPHLRVDFILSDSTLYVGELTFYNDAGFAPITPDKWNEKLGSWINITDSL